MGQGHGGVEVDPPSLALLQGDVGGRAVEADAHALQLSRQDVPVRVGLGGVQDHQQQVGAFAHRNDLTSPTWQCTKRHSAATRLRVW